jgi:gluconolactonase
VERPQELDFQGVYRVGSDPKTPELLVDDFDRPNGLCFSLDESKLFINDTARKHIRVFDVTAGGTLTNGRVWAETKGDKPGAPDGMKIDSAGNVYCCGPGGIHVFTPEARLLEVIETPEYTANFAWGDDDYRSLFVTASTSLYRLRLDTPGLPVF